MLLNEKKRSGSKSQCVLHGTCLWSILRGLMELYMKKVALHQLHTRGIQRYWAVSGKDTQASLLWKKVERAGTRALFSLEKRKLREDLSNVYKYLKGRCEEDGSRLFSLVPRDKKQWAPTETQKVPSEHQEKHFYSEGDQEQVAQRHGGVFLLRDIQKPSGHCPGLHVALLEVAGQGDLQKSLSISTILSSCEMLKKTKKLFTNINSYLGTKSDVTFKSQSRRTKELFTEANRSKILSWYSRPPL